jgi:hypothetical protein
VLRSGASNTAAAAITTAQKALAELRQAGMTAPMTVRHRPPGQIGRENVVARDRHRVGRQQITRRRRG